MTTPITQKAKQKGKFPTNQEVTMNADGSGCPINLSPLKQTESYDQKTARFENFEKGKDTLISGSSVNHNMAKRINMSNTSLAALHLKTDGKGGKGTVSYNIPKDQKTLQDKSTGNYRVDTVHNKEKLKKSFKSIN